MSASGVVPPAQRTYRRDEWGAVSFAVFLILVGVFWLAYPSVWSEIGRFFTDLKPIWVNGVPIFVEPAGDHSFLYMVAAQFFVISSLWLFGLTVIRFYHHGNPRLVSETLTRGIFLLGLGIFTFELQSGAVLFRSIVPLVVVLFGATLIVRGLLNVFLLKGTAGMP